MSGMSIGLCDMIIPKEKEELITAARWRSKSGVEHRKGFNYGRGAANMIIDIWTDTNDKLTNKLFDVLEENDDHETNARGKN